MKNLEHFKKLLESLNGHKEFDYENIPKLTVRGKDGKKTVHKASDDGKTVEDAEAEKDDTIKDKPKKKLDQYKSKDKKETDTDDSKESETKKED